MLSVNNNKNVCINFSHNAIAWLQKISSYVKWVTFLYFYNAFKSLLQSESSALILMALKVLFFQMYLHVFHRKKESHMGLE